MTQKDSVKLSAAKDLLRGPGCFGATDLDGPDRGHSAGL
jgi:hypothetical protein